MDKMTEVPFDVAEHRARAAKDSQRMADAYLNHAEGVKTLDEVCRYTAVLMDLGEVESMLAWAEHVETYSLGYTGRLIDMLTRAKTRLEKRQSNRPVPETE